MLNYTFRKLKKVESQKFPGIPAEFENSGIPGNSNSRIPGGPDGDIIR